MHTHPWGGFIYIVQPEPMRNILAGGVASDIKNIPAGVKIIPATAQGMHSTENVGDGELHAIRFELKHMTASTR